MNWLFRRISQQSTNVFVNNKFECRAVVEGKGGGSLINQFPSDNKHDVRLRHARSRTEIESGGSRFDKFSSSKQKRE